MKIEKRGKYAGVKVHLEPDECEAFIKLAQDQEKVEGEGANSPHPSYPPKGFNYMTLSTKLGKKISKLLKEEPSLLKERTPEEIQHELEVELESAQKKIHALKTGGNWKEIHVK